VTGPLEAVSDLATSGMILAFNWFSGHPMLSGGLTVVFGGSWVATNVIRGWYPEARRPRWARATLEVCGPVAAIVRRVLRKASGGRAEARAGLRRRKPERRSHRHARAS
jgi:hypothetical protein